MQLHHQGVELNKREYYEQNAIFIVILYFFSNAGMNKKDRRIPVMTMVFVRRLKMFANITDNYEN